MGQFLKKRKVYDKDGVVVPTGLDTSVDLLAGNLVTGNTTVTSIAANSIVFTDATSTLIADGNLTFDGTTLSINGAFTVDDITIDGNTVSSTNELNLVPGPSGNLVFDISSGGEAKFIGSTSVLLPSGTDAERPIAPQYGEMRFNTDNNTVEVYQFFDGQDVWFPLTPNFEINSQTEAGDGSTFQWPLEQNAVASGLIVTLNGVLQEPGTAYTTFDSAGTTYIQFASAPAITDTVVIRFISAVSSVTQLRNGANDTLITLETAGQYIDVTGDILPTANVTYDLGSNSLRWKDIYLSGNSIYLGNLILRDDGLGQLGVYQGDGVTEAIITSTSDNSQTADKWTTPRTMYLGGDVSGNVIFDGSSDFTITATVQDNSHAHNNYVEKTSEQALRAVDALQVSGGNTVTIVKGDDTTESVTVSGTLTSLSIVGNTLTYVDELGSSTNIDLSQYIDDTNLARLVSGTVNGTTGIATFTRDDSSTFTVDFSALFDDTNLARVTSGSLNETTGILTFTRSDSSTFNVDLSAFLTAGPGSGLDADTVDGKHYNDIIADATAIAIALG